MKPLTFVLCAAVSSLAACTTLERGSVAESYTDGMARIHLGSADGLQVGSRVDLIAEDCEDNSFDHFEFPDQVCKQTNVGRATVQEVLDSHISIVKADGGANVQAAAIARPITNVAH